MTDGCPVKEKHCIMRHLKYSGMKVVSGQNQAEVITPTNPDMTLDDLRCCQDLNSNKQIKLHQW